MNEPTVFFFDDRIHSGAYAYLAFDGDTSLPAIGGIRVFPYPSMEAAQEDVKQLASCMTLKATTHALPLSGAKMVCSVPRKTQRNDFFKRLGQFIDGFNGRYIAAMDSGVSYEDMDTLHATTPYVCNDATIGSPAPYTAEGVYQCMIKVNASRFEQPLSQLSVSVIGAGAVGSLIIDRLQSDAIGKLLIAESNPARESLCRSKGIACASTDEVIQSACDILSPCALTALITRNHLMRLRCRVILGAANHPLASDVTPDTCREHSVIMVPDTISNAGGLIFCAAQYFNNPELLRKIDQIAEKAIDYIKAYDPHFVA